MAELFGKKDGCSGGRGGSMHLFDLERRFMGGYGIVGGNLPLAAGLAFASDYRGEDDATLCMMGDGATNQGTFGETMNFAALWKLPVVFVVVNNQFGMGTSLERHSAVTDLSVKAAGFGVPGHKCDGMDVLDTHAVVGEAVRCAREQHKPQLVEAVTYRFKGHSVADPEEYRSDEEVAEWKKRDPITTFADKIEGLDFDALDEEVVGIVDAAVEFADASPFPALESIYENLYV
jgi:pyruvate dehydrogenase E1 component alpha subunit